MKDGFDAEINDSVGWIKLMIQANGGIGELGVDFEQGSHSKGNSLN